VGRLGLEPRTNGLKRPGETAGSDATIENAERNDTRGDATTHEGRDPGPPFGPPSSAPDPVDAALAEAMLRASRDGQADLMMALVTELRARRLARERGDGAGVVDLATERERRGR
jgi:hypothetical protein